MKGFGRPQRACESALLGFQSVQGGAHGTQPCHRWGCLGCQGSGLALELMLELMNYCSILENISLPTITYYAHANRSTTDLVLAPADDRVK